MSNLAKQRTHNCQESDMSVYSSYQHSSNFRQQTFSIDLELHKHKYYIKNEQIKCIDNARYMTNIMKYKLSYTRAYKSFMIYRFRKISQAEFLKSFIIIFFKLWVEMSHPVKWGEIIVSTRGVELKHKAYTCLD